MSDCYEHDLAYATHCVYCGAADTSRRECPARLRHALDAALATLRWHEDRHGTRAEQEAEEAESEAELARIDALTPEQVRAELLEAGYDRGDALQQTTFGVAERLAGKLAVAKAERATAREEGRRAGLEEAAREATICADEIRALAARPAHKTGEE